MKLLVLALFLVALLFIQADALRRGPMPGGHFPLEPGCQQEVEAVEYFNTKVTNEFYNYLTQNKLMGDKDPFAMNTKPMVISVTSQVVAGLKYTYHVKYDNADWKITVVKPLPHYDPQQNFYKLSFIHSHGI
eukprot:UN01532